MPPYHKPKGGLSHGAWATTGPFVQAGRNVLSTLCNGFRSAYPKLLHTPQTKQKTFKLFVFLTGSRISDLRERDRSKIKRLQGELPHFKASKDTIKA